ncbi:MAG TPA: beta-ketoacyl reductase, partial [Pseudonocardia sp.]|nr:beta-ketoacyl reductase [Pseudonocardia sp.]
ACGVAAARVPPGEHTRLAGLLRDGRFDRLVHLGALAVDGDRPSDAAMLTEQVLGVLRVLDRQPEAAPVLHIATRRAVLAGEGDTGNAAQAVLWGLGRTVALEHPERWGGLLDLDDGGVGRWASALVAEWAGGGSGGQACLRGGQRLVPRLRSCAPAAVPPSAVVDDGRAHLVVGGTGRLGPHVLDALIDEGARCLVVASRSGTAPVPPRPDRGAVRVVGVPVDIRDREAVRTLFGRFGADLPPLGTVVHAAFAQSIAPLSRVDAATVAEMHEVKIAGLALLHELAAAHGAREVVCLSSTTGLFGSVGLGHYAAASCYLDVFAGNRTGGPTPVRALLLGPCADGLAGTPEAEHVIRSGFRLMDGARAVATGMRARDVVRPPVVVDADWARLGLALATATESPLLRDVGPPDPGSAAEIPPPPPSDPGTDPARVLREEIRRLVAEAMGVAEDAIGVQQNLFTLGMDSLMSLAVVRGIRTALGHELHPRDIRDNPTVAALAEHVARGAAGPAGAPRDRRPTT